MTITINNKQYKIVRNAEIEYRSNRVNPNTWVAMYLADIDTEDNEATYIAWYYVEDLDNTELDSIDYESPYDIEDI